MASISYFDNVLFGTFYLAARASWATWIAPAWRPMRQSRALRNWLQGRRGARPLRAHRSY